MRREHASNSFAIYCERETGKFAGLRRASVRYFLLPYQLFRFFATVVEQHLHLSVLLILHLP